MIELIENRKSELESLCRKYHVKKLELFGSAATGNFDPLCSDLDFLVEFLPLGPGQLFDHFFDLKDSLQMLFGRPVDLVLPRAIRNPYLQKSVDETRRVLYAA